MESSDGSVSNVKNSLHIRIFKWASIVSLFVVLAILLIVPVYMSSGAGKKLVIGKINDSVEGKVEISDLSMGWFKGIRLKSLSFKDTTGATFVNIESLKTKPSYLALLFGNIELTDTEISKPDITVKFDRGKESGTLRATAREISSKDVKASNEGLTSIALEIIGGDVSISPLASSQRTNVLNIRNIESKVDLKPGGKRSSFDIKMDVDDGAQKSKISAKGDLRPGGKKNWTLKGTSGDFDIEIKDLDLKSLSPLFALMGKDIDASGKLNADITASMDDGAFEKLHAEAILDGLEKKIDGKVVAIDEPIAVSANISSSGKKIKIDNIEMTSSFCVLSCSGGTESVNYEVVADLEGTQSFAEQFVDMGGYKLKGQVVESGKMTFEKSSMTAKGAATIKGLEVSKDGVKDVYRDDLDWPFDIVIDTNKNVFQIASMEIAGKVGKVSFLKSSIPLGETSKEKMSLDVKADVDLGKAKSIMALTGSLPEDMELGGRVKSKVLVNSGRDGYHIVTNGATIENFKLGKAGEEPFVEKLMTITVDMMADPENKSISIDELEIESSQIKITKGKIEKSSKNGMTTLDGKLVAKYDLSGVSKAASAFLPEGLVMEGEREDILTINSVYPQDDPDGMMANLNAEMPFGFEKAEYLGLNIGKVDFDVKVENGLLTIPTFKAKVNDGEMNFGASVDFNQKPSLLKTPGPLQIANKININDKTTDKLLKYVNPIFAGAVNVSGVADFKCTELSIPLAGASKNDITVKGEISMNDVRLNASGFLNQILSVSGTRDPVLTMLPTEFVLENGYLSYENMQINIGDRPLNFHGKIGLDKSIDMNVELPFTYGLETTSDASATDRIALPVDGNVDNPKIDMAKVLLPVTPKIIDSILDDKLKDKIGPEGTQWLKDLLKGL